MQVLAAALRLRNGPRPARMLSVTLRTPANVAVKDSQLSRADRCEAVSSSR